MTLADPVPVGPPPDTMKVLCSDYKVREISIYILANDLTSAWLEKLSKFLESRRIEMAIIDQDAITMPNSRTLQKHLHNYFNALTEQNLRELRQKKLFEYETVAKELGIEIGEKEFVPGSDMFGH